MVYKLTAKELELCACWQRINNLPFMKEVVPFDEREAADRINSLFEKGYMIENESGATVLDEDLWFVLEIAKTSYGWFMADGRNGKKECAFFVNDSIALYSIEGESIEIMWLPTLPFVIGRLAGVLEERYNEKTEDEGFVSYEDYGEKHRSLIEGKKALSWEFSFGENGESRVFARVYENEEGQTMLLATEEGIKVFMPDKADYINSLTNVFANIHSRAIRAGGILNDGTDNI